MALRPRGQRSVTAWHSAAGYWIVKPDRLIAQTLHDSLLQDSMPQLHRLEALHREERDHLVSDYRGSVTDTGTTDMALNTNWMRRTALRSVLNAL